MDWHDPPSRKPLPLSEANTEQTAVLSGIRQAGRDDVLSQIKVRWQLGRQCIFIHGDDILKPEAVSHFSLERPLQGQVALRTDRLIFGVIDYVCP